VAQLSQAREVVPFHPSLNDLAVPNTIDCDVFRIHDPASRWVQIHRTALSSAEMVPHGNLIAFSKYVEDYFLGVRKDLKFAAKKHHEIRAASDGRVASGNTVPHKVCRDKIRDAGTEYTPSRRLCRQ
jgi:hypothetical protein